MRDTCQLVILAKEPEPGRVKTRLSPPFTPCQAAELATAALADTVAGVLATVPLAQRHGIRVDPVLVLQGSPGPWLESLVEGASRLRVVAQVPGGLDVRLAAAYTDATAGRASSGALLVGMDTPQLSPQLLVDALATLVAGSCDAVLGLANDGGWWSMGLRWPDPELLTGVAMSTPETGREQMARLLSKGLRVAMLPLLTDVDTAADAEAVARQAPQGQFAATWRRLSRAD